MLIIPLVIVAAALVFLLTRSSKRTPPVASYGLPIVGVAAEFGMNPAKLLRHCSKGFGPVVELNLLVMRMTFLLGNESTRWFFAQPDETLNFEDGVESMVAHIMPGMYDDLEWNPKGNPMIASGFLNPDKLKAYQQMVFEEVDRFCNNVNTGNPVDLFRCVSKMVVFINLRVILGNDAFSKHGEELAEQFYWIEENAFTPQMVMFNKWTFLPFVKELVRRREHLLSLLGSLIEIAYKELQAGQNRVDYISLIVQRLGDQFSWRRYAIHVLGILFAAHTNTAGTIAWALAHISNDNNLQERVREQVLTRIGSPDNFARIEGDWQQVLDLPLVDACMREAVRKYALVTMFRMAGRDFEYQGMWIKKGTRVSISPLHEHFDESVYPQPEEYRPERFADPEVCERLQKSQQYLQFGSFESNTALMCEFSILILKFFRFRQAQVSWHSVCANGCQVKHRRFAVKAQVDTSLTIA